MKNLQKEADNTKATVGKQFQDHELVVHKLNQKLASTDQILRRFPKTRLMPVDNAGVQATQDMTSWMNKLGQDGGKTLQQMAQHSKGLQAALSGVAVGTAEFAAKATQLQGVNKEIAAIRQQISGVKQAGGLNLGSLFSGVGISPHMMGAAALGVVAAHAFQAAASLESLEKRSQAIYGAAFPRMRQEAAQLGEGLGRSTSEMLQMETGFAALLKGSNVSETAMTDLSAGLAETAIQLSNFYGDISDDQAFTMLQAGLTGNGEALQRYGISVKNASLLEYAHRKGIKDKIEAMSPAQQMFLRANMVQDQANKLMGESGKKADTAQAAWKEFRGTVDTAFQVLGKPTLKIATAVLGELNRETKGSIQVVSLFGGAIRDTTHDLMGYVTWLAKAAGFSQAGLIDYKGTGYKDVSGVGAGNLKSVVAENKRAAKEADKAFQGMYGSMADPNKDSDKGAEKLDKVKEAMEQLGKAYQDNARTIVQKLVDLDSTHKDKMKGFQDQIEKTAKAIRDLETQYARSLDNMDKRDADTLIKGEENVAALQKKFDDLALKRESVMQQGGSIPTDLTADIDKTQAELAKAQSGHASAMGGSGVGAFSNTQSLEQLQSQSDGLAKKLDDLRLKKEALGSGSVPVGLGLDLESTERRLGNVTKLLETAKGGSSSAVQREFSSRKGLSDEEKSLADSKTQRDQLKQDHADRLGELNTETDAVKLKRTAEETAYSSARTQLQLTQTALGTFTTDYSAKMADLAKVTEDTVKGMNAKLEELKSTISGIDALLQANATITGGGTLAQRSAARGVQRNADVPTFTPFADGGIVTKPTLALIGEAGPEKVIPLGREKPQQVTVTVGPIYVAKEVDSDALIKRITREIQKISLAAS